MPKRLVETTIEGTRFKLQQLGGTRLAELGERFVEATALTARGVPALATATRELRETLMAATQILVIDEDDPKKSSKWVPLDMVFDDHFSGPRAEDLGKWLVWATKESGVSTFLGGAIKRLLLPALLGRLPSASPKTPSGSSTGSSSTTG